MRCERPDQLIASINAPDAHLIEHIPHQHHRVVRRTFDQSWLAHLAIKHSQQISAGGIPCPNEAISCARENLCPIARKCYFMDPATMSWEEHLCILVAMLRPE